jgi:hypothetical protein
MSDVVVQLADKTYALRIAREMHRRDGTEASRIARDRADHEARLGDLKSAGAWYIIANAIDRLASC